MLSRTFRVYRIGRSLDTPHAGYLLVFACFDRVFRLHLSNGRSDIIFIERLKPGFVSADTLSTPDSSTYTSAESAPSATASIPALCALADIPVVKLYLSQDFQVDTVRCSKLALELIYMN